MKFSIRDFSSTCDKIRSFLRIWSYLLEKSLMENFIFCAVLTIYFFFTKPNLQNHNNLVLSPVDAWVIPKVVQPTESF